MLRTLGFLTGVGIAITGLLVVLEPAELQRLQAETTARLAQVLPQQTDSSGWWQQWRPTVSTASRNPPPRVHPPVPPPVQETTDDLEQPPVAARESASDPETRTSTPSIPHSPGRPASPSATFSGARFAANRPQEDSPIA